MCLIHIEPPNEGFWLSWVYRYGAQRPLSHYAFHTSYILWSIEWLISTHLPPARGGTHFLKLSAKHVEGGRGGGFLNAVVRFLSKWCQSDLRHSSRKRKKKSTPISNNPEDFFLLSTSLQFLEFHLQKLRSNSSLRKSPFPPLNVKTPNLPPPPFPFLDSFRFPSKISPPPHPYLNDKENAPLMNT